ncbi:hypothetical protein K0U73_11980, partial [bacterium]|nr:hypothetical protein [bacterium]
MTQRYGTRLTMTQPWERCTAPVPLHRPPSAAEKLALTYQIVWFMLLMRRVLMVEVGFATLLSDG